MNYLAYDCEILHCIPPKNPADRQPDLLYCSGWTDYVGMGISVITAYTSVNDRYRVFLEDNFKAFNTLSLYAHEVGWETVGFNSKKFDDNLCNANGITVETTYDLFLEAKRVAGAGTFAKGYKLDDFARVNLSAKKQESGALAPELWQRGLYGRVVDYCLQDTWLLKKLFDRRRALSDPTTGRVFGGLIDPATGRRLELPEWIGAREGVTAQ